MLFTLDSLLQWEPPKNAWIIKPLLPIRGTMLIGAVPKLGKSIVAMNVAYDLANGEKIFGIWPVHGPQRVTYFDMEVGTLGDKERFSGIHLVKQGDYAGLNLNIITKDLKLKFDSEEGRNKIKFWIEKTEPNVVIFDPLVHMHSQDENDNSAMHRVMEEIFKLEEEHNVSVILVHHFGKTDPKNPRVNPDRSRGASTIWGDVDTFISLDTQMNSLNKDARVITVDYSLRFDKTPKQTKLQLGDDYVLKLMEGGK